MKLFGFTLIKTKELDKERQELSSQKFLNEMLYKNNQANNKFITELLEQEKSRSATKIEQENYRLNTLLKIAHPGLRRKQ